MAAFYGTFTWPTSLISPSRLATSFTGGGLLQAAKRVRVHPTQARPNVIAAPKSRLRAQCGTVHRSLISPMTGPPAQNADPSALGRARAAHILTAYATEPDDRGLGAGPRVYSRMGTLHPPPCDRAFSGGAA